MRLPSDGDGDGGVCCKPELDRIALDAISVKRTNLKDISRWPATECRRGDNMVARVNQETAQTFTDLVGGEAFREQNEGNDERRIPVPVGHVKSDIGRGLVRKIAQGGGGGGHGVMRDVSK